ncbi:MAG: efflux RND transporter periplasmic adaptor subunit [Eisenbergiella massiliensis]
MDSSIDSAETSRSTTGDTIDFYEENLKDAQVQYGIQNGQAYQDTAAALQNQIASSDVGIQSAMMQLENYTLTAPISGVIEQKNVDEFGMVSAGNPVYVISNKDSMTVTFYVSEAVKNQLTAGETITLERNGETFTAGITQIGQSVDSRTGLFEIKAATENTQLSNGVTVKITADTYRTNDALLLPYDAVYYEAEQAYVYCVEDGIAVKTPVETGLYNEDKIEITGGLAADSIVYIPGLPADGWCEGASG